MAGIIGIRWKIHSVNLVEMRYALNGACYARFKDISKYTDLIRENLADKCLNGGKQYCSSIAHVSIATSQNYLADHVKEQSKKGEHATQTIA